MPRTPPRLGRQASATRAVQSDRRADRLRTRALPPAALASWPHLLRSPGVSPREAGFKGDLRLPAEHFTQPRVVAVAAAHALGLGHIVALVNGLSRNRRDDVDQLVDRNQAILSQ